MRKDFQDLIDSYIKISEELVENDIGITPVENELLVYLDKEEKVEVKQEVIKENEIVDDLLIDSNCPECGYPISKDAAICPHCGILFDEKVLGIIKSNEKKLKKKNKKFSLKKFILDMFLILLFMILIFLVGNMLINTSAENYNNVNGTNVVSEK